MKIYVVKTKCLGSGIDQLGHDIPRYERDITVGSLRDALHQAMITGLKSASVNAAFGEVSPIPKKLPQTEKRTLTGLRLTSRFIMSSDINDQITTLDDTLIVLMVVGYDRSSTV
jgi:hypothetical protein